GISAQNVCLQQRRRAQLLSGLRDKSGALFFYIHLKYRRRWSIPASGHNSFRTITSTNGLFV
ncbi:hypothetical protein, partial [Pseudomonas viridiflava]|uniref:hypothetical protein n=1 Tax=Pseudomonas viridiflava TaxID=33069 RepID=UPI001980C91B